MKEYRADTSALICRVSMLFAIYYLNCCWETLTRHPSQASVCMYRADEKTQVLASEQG